MGRWYKDPVDGVMTYSRYRLKFYEDEIEGEFSEAHSKRLTQHEAMIVFDKLKKHYKLKWLRMGFNGRRTGGVAVGGGYIELSSEPTLGLLCHEISHIIDRKKRPKSKHDKKFKSIMRRVVAYCKKKDYWEDELKRRTAPKSKPIALSKNEERLKRIEKRKNDLARYEKKLGYYTKLYSNKIKKAKRSILMLERNLDSESCIAQT